MRIYRLENVIQNYAWGSLRAIAELTGQPAPSREPQAELWMGTHPKGPSMAVADDERVPLQDLIAQRPVDMLGVRTAKRFDHTLPYLFKVLAAARPLSIQAHPNKDQAVEGFVRESRTGIPLDAPDRNYRDDNHKPEIISALTPFWGLNGFRPTEEAAAMTAPVCPDLLKDACEKLRLSGEKGLRSFFEAMMSLPAGKRAAVCDEIVEKARAVRDDSPVYAWIVKLAQAYPKDLGILSPTLLNLFCLEPGQAIFLPAGQLHAYLEGVGIELMANSDNVLRGGLTPKHVDLPELLRVVRFAPTAIDILSPVAVRPGEFEFRCPADEFVLAIIRSTPDAPYFASKNRSIELLLCTSGQGTLWGAEQTEEMAVAGGDSFLIPAGLSSYTIRGDLTVYKAAVPLSIDRS